MKLIILITCVVLALASAASPSVPEEVQLVRSNFDQDPDGGYQFGYETNDGVVREEKGEIKEVLDEDKKPHKVITVRGRYTYPVGLDKTETVNYSADEDGYKAEGDSIPKVPVSRR